MQIYILVNFIKKKSNSIMDESKVIPIAPLSLINRSRKVPSIFFITNNPPFELLKQDQFVASSLTRSMVIEGSRVAILLFAAETLISSNVLNSSHGRVTDRGRRDMN
jgi:hypothetical protein